MDEAAPLFPPGDPFRVKAIGPKNIREDKFHDKAAQQPGGSSAHHHPTGMNSITTEIYKAAFSTTGSHPQAGVAIARTPREARQRIADMLIFTDPKSRPPPPLPLHAPTLRRKLNSIAHLSECWG